MNNSSTQSGQFNDSQGASIVRVQIPDVALVDSPKQTYLAATVTDSYEDRTGVLQQVADHGGPCKQNSLGQCRLPANGSTGSFPQSDALEQGSCDLGTENVDRVVDSILKMFPLDQPATIVFVGCKTDAETDQVTRGVAQRLVERRVGMVLLVDSNTKSKALSTDLGLGQSEGIGNVICNRRRWKDILQSGPADGLDFLPYGNVNTAKTLRSQTADFLKSTKSVYQFICVSVGLNEDSISKSFCNAADGIYLVIDLKQVNHTQAKISADKLKLKNQPLVGCIALDAEQETQ